MAGVVAASTSTPGLSMPDGGQRSRAGCCELTGHSKMAQSSVFSCSCSSAELPHGTVCSTVPARRVSAVSRLLKYTSSASPTRKGWSEDCHPRLIGAPARALVQESVSKSKQRAVRGGKGHKGRGAFFALELSRIIDCHNRLELLAPRRVDDHVLLGTLHGLLSLATMPINDA